MTITADEIVATFPRFVPHRLFRSGHLQTLAGAWWKLRRGGLQETVRHALQLDDGDQLILHDDAPPGWSADGRAALLIHGLGGCHASSYMVRIARRLKAVGVRVFRLDLRGCGAGRNLARHPYHAGRWPDAEAAAQLIRQLCPSAPLAVAGFSLGGNLLLRWLGESPDSAARLISRAMAINPPVDLAASTANIARRARGAYDRHFARLLYRQVRGSTQWNPDSPLARSGRRPQRLIEFDELYTAPVSGFAGAPEYYAAASAAPLVRCIRVPTLILSALDDPLIPPEMLRQLERPSAVQLHLERHGGHLGYIAARGHDRDRHWMDWRVVEWLTADSR